MEGDAALLLQEFDKTEEFYEEAVLGLEKTFAKPKILIQARLHALFDLPSPTTTATSLGRFRSQYEAHIRGLKSLGANVNEAGYIIAAIILRKLPRKIAENINRASNSTHWTLEELRSAIEMEMEHLTAAGRVEDDHSYLETVYTGTNPTTVNPLTVEKQIEGLNQNRCCVLCYENHNVFRCSKYDSVDLKRDRIKQLGLCYNCLRKNHLVRDCKINQGCTKCSGRHHTSICSSTGNDLTNVGMFNASTDCRTTILPTAAIYRFKVWMGFIRYVVYLIRVHNAL